MAKKVEQHISESTPHKVLSTSTLAEQLETANNLTALATTIDHLIGSNTQTPSTAMGLIVQTRSWGERLFGLEQVDYEIGRQQFWSAGKLSDLPIGLLTDARYTALDPISLVAALKDHKQHIDALLGCSDDRVVEACAAVLGAGSSWQDWVRRHVRRLDLLKGIPVAGGGTLYDLAISADFEAAADALAKQPNATASETLATHRQIWVVLQVLRVRSRGFETRTVFLPRAMRGLFNATQVKAGTILLFSRLCYQGFERVVATYLQNSQEPKHHRQISGRLGPLIPIARSSIKASKMYRSITPANVSIAERWLDEIIPTLCISARGLRADIDAKSAALAKRKRTAPTYVSERKDGRPVRDFTIETANGARTGHQVMHHNMSETALLAVSIFRLLQLLRKFDGRKHCGTAPWWSQKLADVPMPTGKDINRDQPDAINLLIELQAEKRDGQIEGTFNEAIEEARAFFAKLRSCPGGERAGRLSPDPDVRRLWEIYDSTDPLRCAADYRAK